MPVLRVFLTNAPAYRVFPKIILLSVEIIPSPAGLTYDESDAVRNLTLMLQQILAILLVLGLLMGMLYLLRRRGLAQFSGKLARGGSRPKQMQVLERIALSPQHSLHLVSVRSAVFLIGVSPSGCNKVVRLAGSDSPVELQEHD